MFGDFTTNDDVVTVKEEPMLDTDDSKGTTVVEKDDSKENSKGMEDDMFGDFATTNDDVATVEEEPMLISTIVRTTVVEKDDSNSNVVGDSNVSPDNDPKENSKGMEDDMFGDFATTNDDVATVKEEPMLDTDDSKGTAVVEKDDSKENSKGMEDDMFEILLQLMTTWLR